MKKKELSQERGQILDMFVALDTCIAMIIAHHYFNDSPNILNKNDFHFYVLENPRFTWGLKRDILEHILRMDNLNESNLKDLDRLNSIRNIFAHRQFFTGDPIQTPESEIIFSHPRSPLDSTKNLYGENLKKEFWNLFPKVLDWLYKLAQSKGIKFNEIKSIDPNQ